MPLTQKGWSSTWHMFPKHMPLFCAETKRGASCFCMMRPHYGKHNEPGCSPSAAYLPLIARSACSIMRLTM